MKRKENATKTRGIVSGTYIELPSLLKAKARFYGINLTRLFTGALLGEVARIELLSEASETATATHPNSHPVVNDRK